MVIAPAIYDPFPIVVIEALGFGIPAVISRKYGVAGDHENEGALLITDNAQELAHQMI
ncbi:glycosyltransferase [Aquidulcibacter sp.]|uniref:glycosyltransferase n=1 Tax=Aquidulcibacter sp. TaxID=2052990 RepID=UPI0025B90D5C|nr:glycosyltransferase [Aquidulcibacter sp.]MCA3693458.1 glycosyltransferase [Aquidulcibacter sp.]